MAAMKKREREKTEARGAAWMLRGVELMRLLVRRPALM
jgi:hypothetical protein